MEGSCSPPHGGDCTAGMATECHRNTALTMGAFWHHSSTRRRVHTKAKTAVRLVEHGRGRRRLLPAVHASICAGLQDFSPFWPVLDNKHALKSFTNKPRWLIQEEFSSSVQNADPPQIHRYTQKTTPIPISSFLDGPHGHLSRTEALMTQWDRKKRRGK